MSWAKTTHIVRSDRARLRPSECLWELVGNETEHCHTLSSRFPSISREVIELAINTYRYLVVSRLASRRLTLLVEGCEGSLERYVELAFDSRRRDLLDSKATFLR
jgi:hypothetical protein